jgi:hypothetical protein
MATIESDLREYARVLRLDAGFWHDRYARGDCGSCCEGERVDVKYLTLENVAERLEAILERHTGGDQ